jgi:PAS domain S-box-containing protein
MSLLGLLPGTALAASELDNWRQQIEQTRALAESDPTQAYSQARTLQRDLPVEASLIDQARALNLLARIESYRALTEPAAQHAQLALDLAARAGDRSEQAKAHLTFVLTSINQGKVDQSKAAAAHSVELLEGSQHPELLSEAMLRMSMMYRRQGDFERSVTLSMQAMELAKSSKNAMALAYAHQGLAISYDQSGRLVDAHEHYVQMRAQAQAAGSKLLEAYAVNGLAGITASLNDPVSSERLMRESITMYRALRMPFSINQGLYSLADAMQKQGRFAQALPLLNEAAASYANYPNPIGLWYVVMARSSNLQALKRIGPAGSEAQRAYALATEIGFPLYLGESAKRLAAIAAASGEYAQAYRWATQAAALAEKARSDKASTRMVELARIYETESKQRQINELTRSNEQQAAQLRQREFQQRWLWTVVVGGFIFMLASFFFLLHLRRSNRRLERLNSQVQQSQNQLQATLDAIPDALFVLDLDGRCHHSHYPKGELLLPPASEILGQTVSDVLPPAVAHVCLLALREAQEKGQSAGKQIELELGQSKRWFELSVANKPTDSNNGPLFIMLARDITERKQLEVQEEIRRRIFERLAQDSSLTEILALVVRYVEHLQPDVVVSIMLLDKQGKHLSVATAPKLPLAYIQAIDGMEIGEGRGTCGTAAWRGTTVISENLDTDVAWQPYRALTVEAGFRSCWSEPIFDSNGLVLGSFGVYKSKTGRPREEDVRLLRRASYLAATAIERKRIDQDLKETQHLLRQLAARGETAREDERKHLKRELHDELGQYLLALRLGVSVLDSQFGSNNPALLEKTQRLMDMVDTTIKVVRNLVASLRPGALDMGIVSALEWLVSEYRERGAMGCELHVTEDDFPMDDLRDTAIFRIVQESLTNVVRHAKASKVEVTLTQTPRGRQLKVRDNGVGFDPSLYRDKSFGLMSIRERVLMLRGEFKLTSAPGHGTLIEVQIPITVSSSTPIY